MQLQLGPILCGIALCICAVAASTTFSVWRFTVAVILCTHFSYLTRPDYPACLPSTMYSNEALAVLVSTKPGPDLSLSLSLSLSLIFHISMSIEYCHRVVVVAVTFAIVVVVVAVTFAFICNTCLSAWFWLGLILSCGLPMQVLWGRIDDIYFRERLVQFVGIGGWERALADLCCWRCSGEFEHEVTVYPSLHLQNRAPLSKRRQ